MTTGVERAAWALVAAQTIHGATPADTDAEGYVGLVVGALLLVASIAGAVGIRRRRPWAARVTGWTGLAVAVGFVLYHALPFHSPVTNPYLGEGVGVAAWVSVGLAVAAGAWAAYEALAAPPGAAPAPAG
jgi:hypothetical protein